MCFYLTQNIITYDYCILKHYYDVDVDLYIFKAEGETEILIPGDKEERYEKYCEERGGIPYHPNQVKYAVRSTISVVCKKIIILK